MKLKNKLGNTITYIILIALSILWIFPIIWIVLTSFRAESGQFVSYFIPKGFTLNNYKMLFTMSEYPFFQMVFQYLDRVGGILPVKYIFNHIHGICIIQAEIPHEKTDHENSPGSEYVSGIYEYDRSLLYFKSDGSDTESPGIGTNIFFWCSAHLLCCKRVF